MHFLDFGSPGFSWLRFFVFFYHFFFILIICFSSFLSCLIIFFDFFMVSCVLQHFRLKNEENVMNTWQKLMSYKQSQKNEDKMIKKCKKKRKKSKNENFFVAFFRLRLTWVFSAPIFRFFSSCLLSFYHFFFIFHHFSSFSSMFFMISCVLQHFRPKNEENVMGTWQNLMIIFNQSQKTRAKRLIKK